MLTTQIDIPHALSSLTHLLDNVNWYFIVFFTNRYFLKAVFRLIYKGSIHPQLLRYF